MLYEVCDVSILVKPVATETTMPQHAHWVYCNSLSNLIKFQYCKLSMFDEEVKQYSRQT